MSLEHSPLCLLNLSTVPHFFRLFFLTYTLNRNTTIINCLRITYNLNILPRLIDTQRIRFAEAARYTTFSSSPNLIRTYLNHLIRFLNYRCTNSGLIIQKHSILGILGSHVLVHPRHVPVHVAFCWHVPVHVAFCWHVPVHVAFCWHVPVHVGLWWGVPVHLCTCTGTPSEILPRFVIFSTFATNSLHTTSIIHNTSRIIMEIILKQLHNT